MNKRLVLRNREDFRIMKGDKLLRLLRQSYVDFEELTSPRMKRQLQKDWYDWCTYWEDDYICSDGVIPGNIIRVYFKESGSDEFMMSTGLAYTNLNPDRYYSIEIVDEAGGPDQFKICCAMCTFEDKRGWPYYWFTNRRTNPRRKKFQELVKMFLDQDGYYNFTTDDIRISIKQESEDKLIITTTETECGDKEYIFTKGGEMPAIYIPKRYPDEAKLALSKIIGVVMELFHINTTPKIYKFFRFNDRKLSVTEEKDKEMRMKYYWDFDLICSINK